MRITQKVVAAVAATTLAMAVAVTAAGCGGDKSSTGKSGTATSTAANASSGNAAPTSGTSAPSGGTDYTTLLIHDTDIKAPVTFKGTPPTRDPNGQPGAAATFATDDNSHTIKDTIQVLADPAAATAALNAAKTQQGGAVKDPTTGESKIGAGGATLSGNAPDGTKAVTILLFTEGRAFVTLEFDGPPDTLAPDDFVNGVAQAQDDAVKKGLGG